MPPILPNAGGGPGTYESPFYREVLNFVVTELNARGAIHGQRVRGARAATSGTGGGDAARNLNWAYGKKPWCRIASTRTGVVLGTPGSSVMSNRNGKLTLYSVARNVPNRPLLQSLDLTNEGTMGSLLKGKFTFILYPPITTTGFQLGNIEDAFFTPGAEVSISWGWSVTAASSTACTGRMVGIIYSFNWSVNPDLSITADCSVVSAATVGTGQSGDVNTGEDPSSRDVDVAGQPLPGSNLASVIDKDLADPTPWGASLGLGPMQHSGQVPRNATASQLLEYYPIGLPFQEVEPESSGNTDPAVKDQGAAELASTPPPAPIIKPFYYVKLGEIAKFINSAIEQLETGAQSTFTIGGGVPPVNPNSTLNRLFTVWVDGNVTSFVPEIRSAFPVDVYFPDDIMGQYGGTTPFPAPSNFLRTAAISPPFAPNSNVISIAAILIGTDFLKKTYKEFVAENAANIAHKNITSFFEAICKRVNYASGDIYQLATVLHEPTNMSVPGVPNVAAGDPPRTVLSIEDTNLSKEITKLVTPYNFGVDIYRAIIRNASISCKPPAASAAAAYVAARGETRAGGPQSGNSDVKVAPTAGTRDPNMDANAAAAVDPTEGIPAKIDGAITSGFNNAWGEQLRGLITKWKKNLATSQPDGAPSGAGHWMNKAVYPIDLTLTIDGIMGFKFGDTIRCLAIPARYNQDPWNVVFTVTKVSHKIDSGAWTTTLNTKARVAFGG